MCAVEKNSTTSRPTVDSFQKYLTTFLTNAPSKDCPKGGQAEFGDSVYYYANRKNHSVVTASTFMTFHTVLKTSEDYVAALKAARVVAQNITDTINKRLEALGRNRRVTVFPYSIFYVYYEQELTIWHDTFERLGYSLAAIFVVTFVLMGFDVLSTLIISATIVMIMINLMGFMYFTGVALNAISLVNLVMVSLVVRVLPDITSIWCTFVGHWYSGGVLQQPRARFRDGTRWDEVRKGFQGSCQYGQHHLQRHHDDQVLRDFGAVLCSDKVVSGEIKKLLD